MIESLKPSEVVYSKEQLEEFILPNIMSFREGVWPGELISDEDSFAGNPFLAPFVPAIEVAAEVDSRLAKLPLIAQIVIDDVYIKGYSELQIANRLHLDERDLASARRWGLKYICGNKRKLTDFATWKSRTTQRDVRKIPNNERSYVKSL